MPKAPLSIDGLSAPSPLPPEVPSTDPGIRTIKRSVVWGGALLYVLFVLWALVLFSLLPSNDPGLKTLELLGVGSTVVVGLGFVLVAVLGFMRISASKTVAQVRMRALIWLSVAVLPGILLSMAVPWWITGEPPLVLNITSPTTSPLVAPVAVTFSAEEAVRILAAENIRALQFRWDMTGDGVADQETLTPVLTSSFDREGIYPISVVIVGADGSLRKASRRMVIAQSVFSVTPMDPIIERPAVLSVAHLYPDQTQITKVEWDFDGDGQIDETIQGADASTTFFRLGSVTVRAKVYAANNTQTTYERQVNVISAPALPFPVTLITEPADPIGPAPLAVLFHVETAEPVAQVQWTFGDGEKAEGARVAHTFTRRGSFAATAKVRSASGVIAELSSVIRVVESLQLSDLTFAGSPVVSGNRVRGEVPLNVNIQPKTNTPFVEFSWEAPQATEVGSTQTNLQAIYRREGTYIATMVAKDAENRVMRLPITIEVLPPASSVSINMNPESGVAPLTVRFDASETFVPDEDITGFIWSFGDKTEDQYGGARIEHVFSQPGTYTISLTVRTTSGKQYSTNKTLIVRAPLVQSCLPFASRMLGRKPLPVGFSSSCPETDPRTFLWDFNDGSQTDERSPTHTFLDEGTYRVSLTTTDAAGKTDVQFITITVQP